MPLRPVTGKLHMPVDSVEDVRALFDVGRSLSPKRQGTLNIESYRRDLLDHFYYMGAVCPQYFRPFQQAVAELPDDELINFDFSAQIWLYLLQDAPDQCVDHLMARLSGTDANSLRVISILEDMLAGICSSYALEALARYAATPDKRRRFGEEMGFWIADDGSPAVPRFTRQRHALRLHTREGTAAEVARWTNPVGLPISAIVSNSKQKRLVWHYCSFDLRLLPGIPDLGVSRIHLVSPPFLTAWAVFSSITPDGRYDPFQVVRDDVDDVVPLKEMRAMAKRDEATGRGYLELLAFDDQLTYCNGHPMLTPEVVGEVGGPPTGPESIPVCPKCGKTMFFVSDVVYRVREYGDGFRGLYVCEDCMVAVCQGSLP